MSHEIRWTIPNYIYGIDWGYCLYINNIEGEKYKIITRDVKKIFNKLHYSFWFF